MPPAHQERIAGILAMDLPWAEEYWGYGYRMLAFGLDHMLFQAALNTGLRGLRNLASEVQDADRSKQTPT